MSRLSKDSWIKAAFTMLGKQGSAELSIVKMAQALKVTRGSFYYHFNSLGELIDEMVAHWEAEVIDPCFEQAHTLAGSADEEVLLLIDYVTRLTDRQDLLFRQWAAHNAQVRAHMMRLDKKRLHIMGEVFTRLLGDEARGQAFAKIAFYGYIGCLNSYPRPSAEQQRALAMEIFDLLRKELKSSTKKG